MTTWFSRLSKLVVVATLGAVVTAWFRNRIAEVSDEPTPGNATWPPLHRLVEPTDGAPAEPVTGSDRNPNGGASWVDPDAAGGCPLTHPVKIKEASGIFHEPGGLVYDRTRADRCYRTDADAIADGFRASKV